MTNTRTATLYLDRLRAVIFDCDGVVTDTARLHAATWKATLDSFFKRYGELRGAQPAPFDADEEFRLFLDGRSGLDGLRALLAARGLAVPEDGEDPDTLVSLAAEKRQRFLDEIERHDIAAFPSTMALLRDLKRRGVPTAVVSGSRHCEQVLRAVRAEELFDVRVDGIDRIKLGLPGKPDPSLFSEAARRLGVPAGRCAVIEDSLAGVEASRGGGFGVIIGVDRDGDLSGEMYLRGAQVVVRSLADVQLAGENEFLVSGA